MFANPSAGLRIQILDWLHARPLVEPVRRCVFIREQGIPEALEWDGFDPTATHAAALDHAGRCLGTGRLIFRDEQGMVRIGRMAVLAAYRRTGVGSALLETILVRADQAGADVIHLHAQLPLASFYARYGFREEGSVFDEAGIAHIRMIRGGQPIRNR